MSQHFTVENINFPIENRIARLLEKKDSTAEVYGTTSLLAQSFLAAKQHSDVHKKGPLLLVTPTNKEAEQLFGFINSIDPTTPVEFMNSFDVSPYSGLYPNSRIVSQRLRWLHKAQYADKGSVFIASIQALLQKTLPFEVLDQNTFNFKANDELWSDFHQKMQFLGYNQAPLVEDVGTYSYRGGIVDVFSPAHRRPIRIELFGDSIDSLRFFDPETQRNEESFDELTIIPCKETLFREDYKQEIVLNYKKHNQGTKADPSEVDHHVSSLLHKQYFHGTEFLLPCFYEKLEQPLQHFSASPTLWLTDSLDVLRQFDQFYSELKSDYEQSEFMSIRPHYESLFSVYDEMALDKNSPVVKFDKVKIHDQVEEDQDDQTAEWRTQSLIEIQSRWQSFHSDLDLQTNFLKEKLELWKQDSGVVFICASSQSHVEKIKLLLENSGFNYSLESENQRLWSSWLEQQRQDQNLIHVVPAKISESLRFPEDRITILSDSLFFNKKQQSRAQSDSKRLQKKSHALSFADLKPNDFIVHKDHGVGVYKGLKMMPISGIDSEFIELQYKDNDKLYLPVYHINQIQKYSSAGSHKTLDKLGGTQWHKTQVKVKSHLRDIASDLLNLYAERAQLKRKAYSSPGKDFEAFENAFPYEETTDQLQAINGVLSDMQKDHPMDRLICGDVGFGKTEVAMRAAFKAVEDGKQVAIIAPTTILTFQHLQNFQKRFSKWPVEIKALNRFVTKTEQRNTIQKLKDGKVDIVIGTHRLFSRDIDFQNLGLLIIDEEQKFGVKHKEKLRQLKHSVDTLAMSATPIPRTLNMSLIGVRDLSLINTAPIDRLPTRTFITRFDKETIRKAVNSEVDRGGQIFFLHNKVQSIYSIYDELREFLPDVKMAVAHGQMPEDQLEKVIVKFFNHEIDMLICTTIIESGMDIPNANTMFIDNAHQLGLSQLYQLRGRVGRSKERAYCYLLIPKNRQIDSLAQERLKVIQENTSLGSGIQVAQYDLELRGSGNILGENQAGHVNAVGHELYLELLEDAIRESKGEPPKQDVDPEINLKIPALIPDNYISDIRVRLSYYKALSEIDNEDELQVIEDELQDQFGKPPEPVINLMGIMLIRKLCKELKIKDLSSGKLGVSLMFLDDPPLSVEKVIELTTRENKKYTLTPDNRLIVRMKEVTWPRVVEELVYLKSLCPSLN